MQTFPHDIIPENEKYSSELTNSMFRSIKGLRMSVQTSTSRLQSYYAILSV